MIIGVDIDDTVADTVPEWLRWWNIDHERTVKPSHIKQWDISQYTGKDIFDYLVPALYRNVRPIEGALNSILKIRKMGHRVVFPTAFNPRLSGVKFEWLNKNGFQVKENDYIEVADKSLINVDVLVDDGFHNISGFTSNKVGYKIGVLFEREWNKKIEYPTKTSKWEEIVYCLSGDTI